MICGVAWNTQPPPPPLVNSSRKKLLLFVMAENITSQSPKGNGVPETDCQLIGGARLLVLNNCQPVKLVGQEICATPGVRIEMFSVGGTWAGLVATEPRVTAI